MNFRRRPQFVLASALAAVVAAVSITLADPTSPMTITDVDSPDPVAAGSQLTYTVTMVNTGGSKVTNAVMTDQLNGVAGIGVPPQLQITSSRGSCTQSTNLVTCNGGAMEGGGSWTVTIRGVVTAANGTAINNTASVTGTRSAQNFTTTTTTSTLVSNGSGSTLPDLTIAKTGPSSVVVSSPMTYTLTVNNQGTANATNVKVVDTVPAGLSGITATGTSLFTCGVVAQTVTCSGGAVNQGSNATITIKATAPSATGSLTNTASVDPDNTIPESNELNNTSSLVNTQVVAAPTAGPLTINATDNPAEIPGAGPDPATPSGGETYKILVTNSGTTRADDVTIVDGTQGLEASSIQATFIVTNGTVGNGGGCTIAAPQARCLARTLNPGGTILMTVSGQIIGSAGSTIINTATVTGNVKNTGVSATDTELTTVKPGVDLTVTKADSPDPVCARSWPGAVPAPAVCRGGLTYTFVVGNSGINPATGVTLRDPLMPGLLLDSFSAPAFSGCVVDASNVVTCTGGAIGPESTTTVTLTLVAPSAVGTITNIVSVDPNNAIFEADETNNTATATTLVVSGIDLTVSKADAIDPIATSGTETYTIKVNNLGTQDASAIRVRDTLPSGTTFRDVVSDHGFTCSHASGVVECVGGTIKGTASNNYAPLGGSPATPPDTAVITVRIFAQSFAGTMHNEVRVDPLNQIAEADESNNVATQDTVVGSFPTGNGAFNQLTIGKSQVSPANPVARNAKVTYAIAVGNTGSDPAVGVTVRDFLPAGSRFIEATGTNQFLCSQNGGFINCVGGQIPAGGSATITVTEFAPDTPASYVNQAIVDPDNAIPEGDELDNQASVTTIVQNGGNSPFNDLRITKTGNANTTPGGPINYVLQVWNDGSDLASNVTVRDVLPVGVTFVSAADAGGAGAAFTCSQSGGTITCSGATILGGGVGNARTIGIVAKAPNYLVPAPGLHNTAAVDPDNTIPEGDEFNNTSSADTVVSSVVNLTITKEGPTSASQSDVTDYTIVVTNEPVGSPDGQVAFAVRMHDPLPVGLIPLAVDAGSGNNWACQILQNPINVIDCLGDLPPKAENKVTVKITVFVTAENGRSLDNIACVDPDNTIAESNETDNCSEFGAFVAPPAKRSPDLIVSKNVDKLTTTPGDNLTYTLSISNSGTAKAKGWDGVSGLTLSDTLATELEFTTVTATNGWSCPQASPVVCHDNGSGLSPGESAQVTILAHVKENAAIPIANTASAAPGLVDPVECSDPTQCEDETIAHLINNDSTVTSSIGSTGFDLAIATITDNPDPVAPGQGLKYTVVALNGGTATATGVHVELDLPTGGVTFSGAAGSNGFTCGAAVSNKVDCVGNLPGGGTTTITVSFITLLSGLPPSVTLTAKIDPANAFSETDKGNNEKSQTTSITTTGTCTLCVDLAAAQLLTSPEPVASSGTVTVKFQVVNIGDTPTQLNPATDTLLSLGASTNGAIGGASVTSSDAGVVCAVDALLPNLVATSCKGNLQPGQGVTVTLTVPGVTGTRFFTTGTADPGLLVPEFNEGNNSLTQTIVIF